MNRRFTGYLELIKGDYYFRLEKDLDFFVPIYAGKGKGRIKCTVTFTTTAGQDKERRKIDKVIKKLRKGKLG